MVKAHVNVHFRPHQLEALQTEGRWSVRVWHRRAGKTWFTVAAMFIRALQTSRDDWRAYYLAPTRVQARAIAWDYLKSWAAPIPGTNINESDLRVELHNGARIQLIGASDYDALRGRYADDITLDECAQIPMAAWTQVLSPMLTDRKGRATFIGTPQGRMNMLFEMWQFAGKTEGWGRSLLTYEDTGIIDPDEIKRQKHLMRPEEFEAEFLCSWTAALRGAYYSREMANAERAGRITSVKYEDSLPVVAAVDLGWSDGMAVTFWQVAGTEYRCIHAHEWHQTSIPEMVHQWKGLGFPISQVVLPHDSKVHELGSGKTRRQVFHELGCSTVLAPNQGIHEGIEQVRNMLKNAWFDRENTEVLCEALTSYRSEYDEVRGIHSMKPVHNWASHFADSVRYAATGMPRQVSWGSNDDLYAEMARGVI